jgi:hypothetical protein
MKHVISELRVNRNLEFNALALESSGVQRFSFGKFWSSTL